MTEQRRVLVTGAAGYLGSVLCRRLLERGYRVVALDDFRYRQESLLECCRFDHFEVVRGDCRDVRLVGDLVGQADVIIPLAALVGAPACDRDPRDAQTINVDAVQLILAKLSPDQRVLFPNTNSGYGVGEEGKFCTEESPLRPVSLYGRLKCEAEQAVLERDNSLGFRLATVFGVSPRMRLDLLVNDFVWRAVTDRTVVIFEGQFKRNYIHVQDVAGAFLHGLDRFDEMRGRVYNVGLEEASLSKLELAALIKTIVPDFTAVEAPIGEDPDKRDYIVSNDRILATGFKPEWPLARGIRELVKAYQVLRRPPHRNV